MLSITQFLTKLLILAFVLASMLLFNSNVVLAQDVSVLDTQEFLIEHGYSPGIVDGIMGPKTINALREFQRDQHLPESGELDVVTTDAIHHETDHGSETGNAEARGTIDYDGIAAGPEPPVPPGDSVETDKLSGSPIINRPRPITLDAPFPVLGCGDILGFWDSFLVANQIR